MEDFKIAEEPAIAELKGFIDYHVDDNIDESQIKSDFKEVVKAMMRGNLDISDRDAPVLKLLKPIQKENGVIDTDTVKFLTRIPKSQLAALSKGLDINKEGLVFANRMTAYLIQQPAVSMLDKYGKHDMKIIDQLVGLFL